MAGLVLEEHRYDPFQEGIYSPQCSEQTYKAKVAGSGAGPPKREVSGLRWDLPPR